MPALPNVPAVIRNILRFTVSNDGQALIRFFLKYSGTPPSNAQLATFAAGLATAYNSDLVPQAGEGVILESVTSTDLTSSTSGEGTAAAGYDGTRGPSNLPASTCALESLEVDRRYRGGHPRIYWPFGIDSDLADAQHWETAFIDGLATALGSFYTTVGGLTWTGGTIVDQVNVSFYDGFTVHTGVTGRARNVPTPRGSAVIDPVVSSLVRQGIAEQRRRLLALA